MSGIRINDAQIAQAIGVLQRYHVEEMADARAELSGLWGFVLGRSTLSHAFRLRGLPLPSSYLLPRRTAADRFAAPRPGNVPPAERVGDLRSDESGCGARHADLNTDMQHRINPAQVSGNPGQFTGRERVNGSVDNRPVEQKGQPEPGGKAGDLSKFDVLVKLTRHPIKFPDLCDRLDLSPRKCQALIDSARLAGIYVDINHDHVGMRVPTPDMADVTQIGPAPVVGGRHTILVCSDWHFGSKYCMRDVLRDSIQAGYEAGARQVLCAGDILDGAHPDRIHELSHYGMDDQTDDAFETLPQLPGLTYHAITGNHDGWYTRARGVNIGEFIESRFRRRGRDDLHIYGPARKTLMIGTVKCELWHPGKWKGATYAGSYKLERHIDTAYEAGSKPQILIVGHLHRYIKLRRRGIHAMLAPCFQSPESEFSKELGGGVANGALILTWQLTADNTIRRFAVEEVDYFVREMPEELRGVA